MAPLPRSVPLSLLVLLLPAACDDGASDIPADTTGVEIRTVSEYNPTLPEPGVRVRVPGGTWVTTDADGRATLAGVEPPFDLEVFQSIPVSGGERVFQDVWVLRDLTERSVVLPVDEDYSAGISCSVSGQVSGFTGETVLPSGWPDSIESDFDDSTRIYSAQVRLPAAPVRVAAFEVVPGPNPQSPPAQFIAAGQASVDASSMTACNLAPLDLQLQPVTSMTVDLDYALPSSFADARALVYVDVDSAVDGDSIFLGEQSGLSRQGRTQALLPDFGEPLLVVTPAEVSTRQVAGPANGGAASTFSVSGPYVRAVRRFTNLSAPPTETLTVADVPQLISPAEGAMLTADTVFRWSDAATTGSWTMSMLCSVLSEDRAGRNNMNVRSLPVEGGEAALPSFVFDALDSGMHCKWSIERTDTPRPSDRIHAESEQRYLRVP
ncbi:MAG: hypothetical protein AAFZ18_08010 [Myxococcota bacterium]